MKMGRIICCIFLLLYCHSFAQTGGAAINTSGTPADAFAIFDVSSNSQGILIPRLTEGERLAMPNLSTGLMVYQTDGTTGFWYFNGTQWIQFPTVGSSPGDMQYWDGTKWVIIPAGNAGEFLQFTDSGYPAWVALGGSETGVFASITTNTVEGITISTAYSGGNIMNSGGTTITDYGVCWSTNPNPTVNDNFTWDGGNATGSFQFNSTITGLSLSTTYYVRAYATNAAGHAYGDEISFTTPDGVAILTTTAPTSVGATYALLGGTLVTDGGDPINSSFSNLGICWSTDPNPTVDDFTNTTPGLVNNAFVSSMLSLIPGTEYFVRAYGINTTGTYYGNEISFTTNSVPSIAIGETYQGGIIFYVDGSGEHGLIAAPTNQGTGLQWGCNASFVGASGTAVGAGQANTTEAVSGCGDTGIPAKLCDDLVLGGYSDWFLPSKDELELFFANLYDLANLNGSSFWSSSEGVCSCAGNAGAWYRYCPQAGCGQIANKSSQLKVRAVRVF
ncbi:MAG: hypothetical protein IT223_08865 [Crocinitomicaceae bacterium]|nr:hypothetical protein [Crocinitomicaceae bacterium]